MKFQNQKSLLHYISVILVIVAALTLTRCGTQDPTTSLTPGTFASVYSILKSHNCTECHIPTGAATIDSGVKLDFTSQTSAFTTLTTSTVSGSSGINSCTGVKIVVPNSPSTSYLAAVLFSKYSISDFGGKSGCIPDNSHLTQNNLSTADQSSIIDWIQNGAKNN